MNFLAHTYLSPKSPKIMLGNLSGDFIKGKISTDLNPDISKGAKLHRKIDLYTDSHQIVHDAKKIVRPEFGLYSGVVIDMFFDYFLASKWNIQNPTAFINHTKEVYNQADLNHDILPEKFKPVLPYMKRFDWLKMYATIDGLQEILKQMTNRINGKIDLSKSTLTLTQNEPELAGLFNEFWKDISSNFENYPDQKLKI